MREKRYIDQIWKILVVITMILSMCMVRQSPIQALDNNVPKEFVAGKRIDYPWWWSKKIGGNKAWSTNYSTYNGKYAYCLEASKNTPVEQKYPAHVIENNEAVRKLLYYGYGGPGYNEEVKKMYQETLKGCVPDDFSQEKGNWNEGAYLFTHIWLSYAYSGDLMGLSLEEFNKKWPNGNGTGYGDNIMFGYKWILSQPDITYPQFSPSSHPLKRVAEFKGEFDQQTKQQKTNIVKLEGSSQASVNIPLQTQVTLHNVTTGQKQTGGTAIVHGGQSFYLTTPCNNSPDDFNSGNIAGEGCQQFVALAIKSGGNYQTMGSWNFDPDSYELFYKVDWMDFGSLRLSKVDTTSKFQKNSKFRLVSTSYHGYDQTFEVTKDQDGNYELVINYLPVGTYSLTEIGCEDSYAPAVAKWQVTIDKDKVTKKIVVNTLRPTGTLKVQKKLEKGRDDAKNVAEHDIKKTKYQILASDDIVDTVSLKKLYSKGEIIKVNSGQCIIDTEDGDTMTYSKGVQVIKGLMNDQGLISVDENGQIEVIGLPLGKYQVIEKECPQGYVLDSLPHEFKIVQKDYVSQVYTHLHEQINEITKTTFKKTDITGTKEVIGAKMSITDVKGHVIDQWTSSVQDHEIDGLQPGKSYYLNEDTSPAGYVKASSILFKVNQDGKVQKIDMKDKVVTFNKTDITGEKEVVGAKMVVKEKETGKIVDQWISKEQSHAISGLQEGKTYILSEQVAPQEYVKATDIEFTVTQEKVNQKIKMKDKQVVISKTSFGGQDIIGTTMQIIDENGEVVDEWISEGNGHYASNLEEGKTYILHEKFAPAGYNLTDDIEFTVSKDKVNEEYTMVDTTVTVTKTKEDSTNLKGAKLTVVSKKTKNIIDKWMTGEHIFDMTEDMKATLLKGEKVEDMYIDEEDSTVTYSITPNKDTNDYRLMIIKDAETTYYNVDINGDETTHLIQGLVVGEEYILKEIETPKGYATAKEQVFIAGAKKDITLTMIDEDTKIEISKQDLTRKKELEGAHLQIKDETNKVVDQWISQKQPHLIKNLEVGKVYTLSENIAPQGYRKAQDISFIVEDTGKVQKVIMYDEIIPVIKTGDDDEGIYYLVLLLLSLCVGGLFYYREKRRL